MEDASLLGRYATWLLALGYLSHTTTDALTVGTELYTGEYCMYEILRTQCLDNEVIIMDHGFYGRMELGKCLREANRMGCQSDVTGVLHQKCSGRASCSIPIPDPSFGKANPCGEMSSYLEASYKCLPVVPSPEARCTTCDAMKVLSPTSGYLASLTTQDTGCGSPDCPWLLEGSRGQRIIVSLVDFSYSDQEYEESGVCRVYAIIKEAMAQVTETVCGGQGKERIVYRSLGNTVEIGIRSHEDRFFLIHYEFVGCDDPVSISGATFTRKGSTAYWQCDETGEKWPVRCNGTVWVGSRPRCAGRSTAPVSAGSSAQSGFKELFSTSIYKFSWEMVLIAVAIVVSGFVSCVLIVSVVCLKKRTLEEKSQTLTIRRPPRLPSRPPSECGTDYAIYEVCTSRRGSTRCPDGYRSLRKGYRDRPLLYGEFRRSRYDDRPVSTLDPMPPPEEETRGPLPPPPPPYEQPQNEDPPYDAPISDPPLVPEHAVEPPPPPPPPEQT